MWLKLCLIYQKYVSHEKKTSNKSCLELNFVEKRPRTHMSIPPGVELGGSKDWYVSNVILYWIGKVYSLSRLNIAKNMYRTKRSFKLKLFGIEFRPKKVRERICISSPGVKLGGSKDWYVSNVVCCTEMEKYIHFWAQRCQKYVPHEKKSFK